MRLTPIKKLELINKIMVAFNKGGCEMFVLAKFKNEKQAINLTEKYRDGDATFRQVMREKLALDAIKEIL